MSGPDGVVLGLAGFAWLMSLGHTWAAKRYERSARRYEESGQESWDMAMNMWFEAIEDIARRERELEKRLYGEGWKP